MGFCSLPATHTYFLFTVLFYTQQLTDALSERFDDMDEIKDVANYGCGGGVPGLIYYKDTTEFFEQFEDEIEDVCYDILGDDYLSLLSNEQTSVQGLIQMMVWFVVETYCQWVLDNKDAAIAA